MNAQTLIQNLYSTADVEQLVKSIENLLEAYTGAIIVLLAAITIIAGLSALVEYKKTPSSARRIKGRKAAAASLCDSGFERLSLDQSSAH